MLDKRWTMTTLSGDMGPRAGFGLMARSHDLLICTAELLQLALISPEEEEHVELTGKGRGPVNTSSQCGSEWHPLPKPNPGYKMCFWANKPLPQLSPSLLI